jgi:hypothetical protein
VAGVTPPPATISTARRRTARRRTARRRTGARTPPTIVPLRTTVAYEYGGYNEGA